MLKQPTRLPDFFIAGAPRCGTTALYQYLRHHPEIFLPARKEPHYFAPDFAYNSQAMQSHEYLQIYSELPATIKAGEASTWYLYSATAIPDIISQKPDAKIVVMLRNPIDAAHSLHNRHVLTGEENIPDFGDAWGLCDRRRSGAWIPKACNEPRRLLYRDVYSYSHQLQRLFAALPRASVFVGIFEEFKKNPKFFYLDLLRFLEVEDDGRTDFPIVYQSKHYSGGVIANLVKNLYRRKRAGSLLLNATDQWANALVGPTRKGRIAKTVAGRWSKEGKAATLDPKRRRTLLGELEEEIRRVETMLEKELRVWRP